jgi:protein-S-isoprenylcysteine O-methyltransferase Ste14
MFQFLLLRMFGILWNGTFFGIILPVTMVMVALTLDDLVARKLGIGLVQSDLLQLAGIILFVSGILLLIVSSLTLWKEGKAWPWALSPHAAFNPHKLVSSGPYAVVRHPMVLSYLMVLLGIGCFCSSIVMILWLVPLVAGLSYEFLEYTEERRMQRWFGKSYTTYAQRTPSILPHLQGLYLEMSRKW